MKNQTAYLIDPHTFTISEIRSDEGIDWINVAMECDCFTGAYSQDATLPPLYVDDEGLYKENQALFFYRGCLQPFVGKAIAMDVDAKGRSITPKMSLVEFATNIVWVFPARMNGSVKFFRQAEPTVLKHLEPPLPSVTLETVAYRACKGLVDERARRLKEWDAANPDAGMPPSDSCFRDQAISELKAEALIPADFRDV